MALDPFVLVSAETEPVLTDAAFAVSLVLAVLVIAGLAVLVARSSRDTEHEPAASDDVRTRASDPAGEGFRR